MRPALPYYDNSTKTLQKSTDRQMQNPQQILGNWILKNIEMY
jgi:hypothetical protein